MAKSWHSLWLSSRAAAGEAAAADMLSNVSSKSGIPIAIFPMHLFPRFNIGTSGWGPVGDPGAIQIRDATQHAPHSLRLRLPGCIIPQILDFVTPILEFAWATYSPGSLGPRGKSGTR